jgi:hypothetical protein
LFTYKLADDTVSFKFTAPGNKTIYFAALTFGGLIQDYARMDYLICGLEVLSLKTPGALALSIPYE